MQIPTVQAMTPREELMEAIQTSPGDVVSTLLETLRQLTPQSDEPAEASQDRVQTEHLYRKNGVLVAETGWLFSARSVSDGLILWHQRAVRAVFVARSRPYYSINTKTARLAGL